MTLALARRTAKAGTGRFLEVMAKLLGLELCELGEISANSRNPINLVRATVKGLAATQSPARIAAKRGKKLEEILNG